jgi:hypothetical protein
MNEDFIKKGVIESEQEGDSVKTASDELVKSAENRKTCFGKCKCKCNQEKRDELSN